MYTRVHVCTCTCTCTLYKCDKKKSWMMYLVRMHDKEHATCREPTVQCIQKCGLKTVACSSLTQSLPAAWAALHNSIELQQKALFIVH